MSDAPPMPAAPPPRLQAAFPARFGPIFTWGLTRVVRWRKVFLLGAIAVGFGLLIGIEGVSRRNAVLDLAQALDEGVLTFAIPLIALMLAAEGFSFEVQERTLVYHLVRPVSRTTIFVARFFSGLLPATLVSLLFLVAVVASSGVAVEAALWASLPLTAGLATLALAAIYYTLAALLKHGLIAGLVYTFVVETMITSVPGSMQKLSVMFHVRSLHHRLTDDAFARMLEASPGQARLFDMEPGEIILQRASEITYDTTGEAILILVGIAVVALAFGAWKIGRRDFALKD